MVALILQLNLLLNTVVGLQTIPVSDSSRPEAVFVSVTGWLKWNKFQ